MFWLELLCELFFALFFGSGPLAWVDMDRPLADQEAAYMGTRPYHYVGDPGLPCSTPCACPPGTACPAGCCQQACPCKAGINICCPTEFACAPRCPAPVFTQL